MKKKKLTNKDLTWKGKPATKANIREALLSGDYGPCSKCGLIDLWWEACPNGCQNNIEVDYRKLAREVIHGKQEETTNRRGRYVQVWGLVGRFLRKLLGR